MTPEPATRTALALLAVGSVAVAALALPGEASPVADAAAQDDFNTTVVSYGGEVAREDFTVRVRGQASGAREVVFVLVGSSGAVVAETGATGQGGSFDRDVPLEGVDRRLNPGRVQSFVLSPGRDGVFGARGDGPESTRDLVDFARELSAERLSQPQVVRRLRQATVDTMGSDDLASVSQFQLAQATTRITGLSSANATGDRRQFAPGDAVEVRGTTNRRPDQNAVDVTVTRGPSAGAFAAPIVDQWGTDGVWTATIAVPADATPGNYTIRASDGDGRDAVQFEVVEQRAATGVANETANETPTTTATPTTTTTATATPTTTTTTTTTTATTTETPTTTEGQPGFGALVAAVAVALAAVVRRRLARR